MTEQQGKLTLELTKEHSSAIESLKAQRNEISSDMYSKLDEAEQKYNGLTLESQLEGDELSGVNEGLQRWAGYKQTVGEMSSEVTSLLEQHVEFTADSQNFQKWEKPLSWFKPTAKYAERMRNDRMKTQSPAQNLQQVLSYCGQLVTELQETRLDAVSSYERLDTQVAIVTKKVAEYEPQYAAKKEQLEAKEEQVDTLTQEYQVADSAGQAKIIETLNQAKRELAQVQNEHDQVFTVYKQAQEAVAPNMKVRDDLMGIVRDLGRQATMIQEKMDNVTQIYAAAPEAVKYMMTTAGTEVLDKTVNALTDKAVDIVSVARQTINKTTLDREEIELIAPERMRQYLDDSRAVDAEFEARFAKIQETATQNQSERYGLDN